MTPNLLPIPAICAFQQDRKLILKPDFQVQLAGVGDDERLTKAVVRFLAHLSQRTGLFLVQNFPLTNDHFSTLSIFRGSPGNLELREDESYELDVTEDQVKLVAPTNLGVFHGLETLLQLITVSPDEPDVYSIPVGQIRDKPRFPWRGLLIDAGRHFQSVDVILRNLDAMAAVKLNVLHWHLTDDQGFRVESQRHPKLHECGSDGNYYTQSQIQQVVEYAADRGIRVVPEFDLPGHSSSWLVGYPRLGSVPNGQFHIFRQWGISDNVMDPTRETVYAFLEEFFEEMFHLFPDRYFHIGGDEVKSFQWDGNEEIQQFMEENSISDVQELQAYFNNRILRIMQKHQRIMVGWDEILHANMPDNVVIQSWRGRSAMENAARQGYHSILSNGYYIDLVLPASTHYANDPIPDDSGLSEDEKQFILGGEATMWSEFVSPETIDSRIWPRSAAIAERLWSPGTVKDVDDMYRRLEEVSWQLEERGSLHEKNYDMMLRRMTRGCPGVSALRTLVDVLEPVKNYARGQQRKYTPFSPLTRVVDAARPDAGVPRRFSKKVDDFLAGLSSSGVDLTLYLVPWRSNHSSFLKLAAMSPIIGEVAPHSHALSRLASFGLRSVEQLNQTPVQKIHWTEEELKIFQDSKASHAQVELMIVEAIGRLMKASGENFQETSDRMSTTRRQRPQESGPVSDKSDDTPEIASDYTRARSSARSSEDDWVLVPLTTD